MNIELIPMIEVTGRVFERVLIVAVSGACIYWGYRLFGKAATAEAKGTDVVGKAGTWSLRLSRAAPGTCFSLFGATVLVITMLQGVRYEIVYGDGTQTDRTLETNTVQQSITQSGALKEPRLLQTSLETMDDVSNSAPLPKSDRTLCVHQATLALKLGLIDSQKQLPAPLNAPGADFAPILSALESGWNQVAVPSDHSSGRAGVDAAPVSKPNKVTTSSSPKVPTVVRGGCGR